MAKVRVTRALVQQAIRQDNAHCGIALALKELGFDRPKVTQDSISYSNPETGQRVTYTTIPAKVQKWLDDFDSHHALPGPLTFDLNEDEADVVKPIHRSQPSQLIAQAQRDKDRPVHKITTGVKSYRPQRSV
jgi:hypothetical protein